VFVNTVEIIKSLEEEASRNEDIAEHYSNQAQTLRIRIATLKLAYLRESANGQDNSKEKKKE